MTQPTTLADATRLAQEIEHHLNQVLIGQRQVVREVLQRQHLLQDRPECPLQRPHGRTVRTFRDPA